MKFCFVIPCYNHDTVIRTTVEALSAFNYPIIIVDDGSQLSTKDILISIADDFALVELVHHQENQGKGAAMQTGLQLAIERQFSHALQVDADGQHDIADVEPMLAEATLFPHALISGRPVYDETIPKSRYYGRFITHFWVSVETLSFKIIDSMCGYRVYPLSEYQTLVKQATLGRRMDFDTEVMVRLAWQGVALRFINTKVHYPEFGLSHFDAVKDNILISKMHTRLFFGMLIRLPTLLIRKFN